MTEASPVLRAIWEWPLRVWHWLFALCVAGSLATGLSGDITLMDWHLRLGYTACGLLLFRLLWGFVGGRHSRWGAYRVSPGAVLGYFRGQVAAGAHTPPGNALVLVLLSAVLLQVVTGLFTTDDIFLEGPLVRYGDDELVGLMTAMHHRIFWVVIGAITVHLTAHVVYALRGNPLPLAMITGRKRVPAQVAGTDALSARGLAVGALAALAAWGTFSYLL